MKAFENAIVLTGGIATGKSSATKIFSKYGFENIDADRVAHEILNQQAGKIVDIFGDQVVTNGRVNRKALGKIVFSDKQKLALLETLLHPLIYDEIETQAKKLNKKQKPFLVDIPLFFEKQNYPIGRSILVYAPRELQLQRLMSRDGYSEEEANVRVDAQMNIEEKRSRANYVIENKKDLKYLESECRRVINLL